jgi:hypothetical protein
MQLRIVYVTGCKRSGSWRENLNASPGSGHQRRADKTTVCWVSVPKVSSEIREYIPLSLTICDMLMVDRGRTRDVTRGHRLI